jgi:hypothetical protein
MLGYGAATAMAIYEMATYVSSSQCYIKDSDVKTPDAPPSTAVTVAASPPPAAAPTPVATSYAIPPRGEITSTNLAPLEPATVVPAAVVPAAPVAVAAPVVAPAPPAAAPDYRFADPAKKGSYDPSVYDRAQEMLKRNGLKRSDLNDNRLQIFYNNSEAYINFDLVLSITGIKKC